MNPTYDFTGQVALVVGASSGMGLATARAFAEAQLRTKGEYRRPGGRGTVLHQRRHLGPPQDPVLPPAKRARQQRRSAWAL
jgi:NAD(P)-dependent dehydrogenase (short-subunit alcohol dehydrogenase family)